MPALPFAAQPLRADKGKRRAVNILESVEGTSNCRPWQKRTHLFADLERGTTKRLWRNLEEARKVGAYDQPYTLYATIYPASVRILVVFLRSQIHSYAYHLVSVRRHNQHVRSPIQGFFRCEGISFIPRVKQRSTFLQLSPQEHTNYITYHRPASIAAPKLHVIGKSSVWLTPRTRLGSTLGSLDRTLGSLSIGLVRATSRRQGRRLSLSARARPHLT